MVEPVDVLEGGPFDVVEGTEVVGQFGLVEADDRLGEGAVVRVAYRPDRGFGAGFD